MVRSPPVFPHTVDVHVGRQIRDRRTHLNVSQAELAARLGLSFQQVQKYERGFNRVSASALHAIAQVLQVEIDYFFIGLGDGEAAAFNGERERDVSRFLNSAEGIEIAAYFTKLKTPEMRGAVLELVRAVADG